MINSILEEMPSIIVCLKNPEESFVREITAGIEEEGIPYKKVTQENMNQKNMLETIHLCSQKSRIGIAIGVLGKRVILHYVKLKESEPIMDRELSAYDSENCRKIGCNAARLYKVMPFKDLSDSVSREDIIKSIVQSVIKSYNNL